MIRRRHLFSLLGAVIAALVVCLGTGAASEAAPTHHATPGKLTKHQKLVARRALRRRIAHDPRIVLRRGFLKKAQALDLTLPLTLRLRRSGTGPVDDALGVEWDSSTWAWPATFVQLVRASASDPSPGGTVPLDGLASVAADFGNDVSGYGGFGVVETANGRKLAFASGPLSAPISVSSLAGCGDATVPGIQITRMDLFAGEGTTGLLSLFGGAARVSLHVRLGTTTRALAPDCSGAFGDLPDGTYDQMPAPPTDDPIVPISFDAIFRISPAIDADGQFRLGVLTLPAGVDQPTTFARISTCVQQAATGPCDVARFPARLSMTALNAEVLIGDQIS